MIEFSSPLLIVYVELLLFLYGGFCMGAFCYDRDKGKHEIATVGDLQSKWVVRVVLVFVSLALIKYMQIQTTNAVEYGRMLGGVDG